jgi:hypothetical protein
MIRSSWPVEITKGNTDVMRIPMIRAHRLALVDKKTVRLGQGV